METFANFVNEKRTEIKNNFEGQFFVNELRHHYNLRQPKAEKPTMVFFVVRINSEQVKISTGMRVYPKHWDVKRAREGGCIPYLENENNRLLNECLSIIDARFIEYKNYVNEGILSIGKESLKEFIKTGKIMTSRKKEKTPIDVAKVLQTYIRKDTSIKDGTRGNYLRFIKKFGEYLSGKNIRDYTDITFELMKGFQQWCVENTKGKNGQRASGESINKIVECTSKCLRTYLVENGLMSGSQYHDIQVKPLKEVSIDDEIALRDDELTLLYNYQCADERDEKIKDLFLLECTTGQRFSDIEKVDDLIEQKDGRTYFNLVQDKGGAKVQVDVLFQMALDILKKYSFNKLPACDRKVFNKRIKEIAKDAGISGAEEVRYHEAGMAGVKVKSKERHECISSHTGRRTFTTMLSLRGFNDTEIARYTGHSSLIMVRRYDKSKVGTKTKEMFENLKLERPECVLKTVKEHIGSVHSTTNTPAINTSFPKPTDSKSPNEFAQWLVKELGLSPKGRYIFLTDLMDKIAEEKRRIIHKYGQDRYLQIKEYLGLDLGTIDKERLEKLFLHVWPHIPRPKIIGISKVNKADLSKLWDLKEEVEL